MAIFVDHGQRMYAVACHAGRRISNCVVKSCCNDGPTHHRVNAKSIVQQRGGCLCAGLRKEIFELEHIGRTQHALEFPFIDHGQMMQRMGGEKTHRFGDRFMDTDRKHWLGHNVSNALVLHDYPWLTADCRCIAWFTQPARGLPQSRRARNASPSDIAPVRAKASAWILIGTMPCSRARASS